MDYQGIPIVAASSMLFLIIRARNVDKDKVCAGGDRIYEYEIFLLAFRPAERYSNFRNH